MKKGDKVVILTGAGISAESGIQTFRGADGLWCGHKIEDVATPEAFIRNPSLVHAFYNERRTQLLSPDIKPNPAHCALVRLEKASCGHVHIITQNIDNLHERAGSQNLIHMHGELLKMICLACGTRSSIHVDLSLQMPCPACCQKKVLRPDIVWFGEIPYDMDRINELINDCNILISIGTSGNVYPAAGFAHTARAGGAHCVELNLEQSLIANNFHEHILGPASLTVPALVDKLIADILNP